MLKIRYFAIRLGPEVNFSQLSEVANRLNSDGEIVVVGSTENELILQLTTTRTINVVQFLPDGSRVPGTTTTMEQYLLRIFRLGNRIFLSLIDPPRGMKLVTELLALLLPEKEYFVAEVELQRSLIERHVSMFESSKMVSAKVKDFQIYEKAIARLEVSSKEGLHQSVAPFLENKFYRVESLTYEMTHQFKKGLVQYLANGTVKISPSLVEFGFPSFEKELAAT